MWLSTQGSQTVTLRYLEWVAGDAVLFGSLSHCTSILQAKTTAASRGSRLQKQLIISTILLSLFLVIHSLESCLILVGSIQLMLDTLHANLILHLLLLKLSISLSEGSLVGIILFLLGFAVLDFSVYSFL